MPEPKPTVVSFFVPGLPAPGGSKRGFPIKRANGTIGVSIVDDAKRNAPWRASVALEGSIAMDGREPLEGPLSLDVEFVMPRRKAHFRANGGVKITAPTHHASKPDRTKLLRALEDALTKIVWRDDTQVVDGRTTKRYGDRPGAHVKVRTIDR